MKVIAILAVFFVAIFSVPAAPPTWEELAAHLFTNAVIVWQAPTNRLPKNIWIYESALNL